MRYASVVRGTFLDRPNRFVARVRIGGETEAVHVKNTGRCRELLTEGAEVWLDGFVFFNPQERRILEELLKAASHVHISLAMDADLCPGCQPRHRIR